MGSRLYTDYTSVGDGQSSHLDHNDEDVFQSLPDHLLLEVLVRVPMSDWRAAACTRKRWAALYKSEALWWTALSRTYPAAVTRPRWPGPIGRGSSERRYTALHVSKSVLPFLDDDLDEVAGHVYLYLKDQLESSMYISYCLLHATVIDQFLACKKPRNVAQELASQIWLAVIDNLEETERTFRLLMRITDEWEVFQPYPYSRSPAVQWRLFERLFTDFRDFLSQCDYYEVLSRAKVRSYYKFKTSSALHNSMHCISLGGAFTSASEFGYVLGPVGVQIHFLCSGANEWNQARTKSLDPATLVADCGLGQRLWP